jgi:hypothetical protein
MDNEVERLKKLLRDAGIDELTNQNKHMRFDMITRVDAQSLVKCLKHHFGVGIVDTSRKEAERQSAFDFKRLANYTGVSYLERGLDLGLDPDKIRMGLLIDWISQSIDFGSANVCSRC